MKLLILSVIACCLTLSSAAVKADEEYTMIGNLKPNEVKHVKVAILEGEQTLEVKADNVNAKITCSIYDGEGKLSWEQKSTNRCETSFDSTHHGMMKLVLANEQNKKVAYVLNLQKK